MVIVVIVIMTHSNSNGNNSNSNSSSAVPRAPTPSRLLRGAANLRTTGMDSDGT